MMFVFLFLIFSGVVGLGIYVYAWLKQEQKKFIAKDKYDQAWDAAFKTKKGGSGNFMPIQSAIDSSWVTLLLGVVSCVSFIFMQFVLHAHDEALGYFSILIVPVYLLASAIGLFIGVPGLFLTKNESMLMRLGGILLIIVPFIFFS